MVTNAAWLTAWKTISISGVTSLTSPPASLDRVKLPAGWPEDLTATLGEVLVSCLDANMQRRIIYRIAVGSTGQKTLAINYDETAALMDNVEAALKTMLTSGLVNFLDFTIRMVATNPTVAGLQYWGFEIDATGRSV